MNKVCGKIKKYSISVVSCRFKNYSASTYCFLITLLPIPTGNDLKFDDKITTRNELKLWHPLSNIWTVLI